MNHYKIDFHCHSGLRTLLKEQHSNKISPWNNVDVKLPGTSIMDAQSSFDQLMEGGVKFVVVAIYPPEMEILSNWKLKYANLSKWIDGKRLKNMANGTDNYFSVANDEINNLLLPPIKKNTHRKFVLLRRFNDYDPNQNHTLFGILSLEGAHILYGYNNQAPSNIEWKTRLRGLLSYGYIISHMTITHVTDSIFANHAYAIKAMKGHEFIPKGFGITNEGWELINTLIEKNILIDLKHLSKVSRQQVINKFRDPNPNKPIVVSHSGFTGLSWENLQTAPIRKIVFYNNETVKIIYDPVNGHIPQTNFLPTSINLYDEEILAVVQSNGMIGLIMDKRILGSTKKSKEYVSDAEYTSEWMPRINQLVETAHRGIGLWEEADEVDLDWEIEEKEDGDPREPRANYSINKFVNHLIHYALVTANLPNRWDCICLGSDYDGMIASLPAYKTAASLNTFENDLINAINAWLPEFNGSIDIPVETLVRKLLYDNAFNFLKNRFTHENPIL